MTENDGEGFILGIGLGSMIAEDEAQEQEVINKELQNDDDSEVIPLSDRFETKANARSRPIVRWLQEIKNGTKKPTDLISYTPEEMMRILEKEGLGEI
jgi:hypothetical protein